MSRRRTSSTGALVLAQVPGIKPHKVQGRQIEEVREKDPDGRIVVHHRTVDSLGKMLRSGAIDQAMHDAARDFQAAFIVAQLDPLRAIPILRVPGTGREPELGPRQLHARRWVHAAMEALRGISSPAGWRGMAAPSASGLLQALATGGHRSCRRLPEDLDLLLEPLDLTPESLRLGLLRLARRQRHPHRRPA
jgi:hypothetical protein